MKNTKADELTPEQIAARATVTHRGEDWGDTPLWTVESEDAKASFDVHAADEAEARASAVELFAKKKLDEPAETSPDGDKAAKLEKLASASSFEELRDELVGYLRDHG